MGIRNLVLSFWILLVATPVHAGVGDPLDGFLKSEFARFFNITESERTVQEDGATVVRFEPGAKQESIDLVLWVDSDGKVYKAALHTARDWVGDEKQLNLFAKDLIKSFIAEMVCASGFEASKALVKALWDAQGSVDKVVTVNGEAKVVAPPPETRVRVEALYGQREEHVERYEGCEVQLENWTGGDFVWLSTRITGPEPVLRPSEAPAPPPVIDHSKLFLSEEGLKAHGLKLTQDSPDMNMKVWTRPEPDALVQRLVDIRWIFETAEEATKYHLEHLKENSEGAPPLKLRKSKGFGTDLRAFLRDAKDPMLAKMGLDTNMYCFLFTHGRVLAKVFIAGSHKLGPKEAAALAKAAQNRIEAGLPPAVAVPIPEPDITPAPEPVN